jgi:hypothetical protein
MNFFDQTDEMLDVRSAVKTTFSIVVVLALGAIGALGIIIHHIMAK